MNGSMREGVLAALAAILAAASIGCSGGGGIASAGAPGSAAGVAASAADAGGGNGSGAAASPTGIAGAPTAGKIVEDVCSLLSTPDLKSVLGIDFPAGSAKDVSGSTATCDWEVHTGTTDALVSLVVESFDQGQWDIAKKLDGSRTVPGLGDDAVLGFLDVLDVKKGDRDFTIEIVLMPAASAATLDDQKIQLARLVLGRLR
jgi:hypothetical protein